MGCSSQVVRAVFRKGLVGMYNWVRGDWSVVIDCAAIALAG